MNNVQTVETVDNSSRRNGDISYYWYCIPSGLINGRGMNQLERFYQMDQLLKARRSVPKQMFLDQFEISNSQFKRDLDVMLDRFRAPIVYSRELKGYCYEDGADFELPGLWMNSTEIHALLTMQQLLSKIQPGLLGPHIEPLINRISKLIERDDHSEEEVRQRIRVLNMASREFDSKYFEIISSAVLSRKRMNIVYYNRADDTTTSREISPQRLVHYRDNWYLDAWCHLRDGLRCFSIDVIQEASLLDADAETISNDELDAQLGAGYGIFSGKEVQQVELRFSPLRSRWVSNEQWHPEQEGWFDDDGYYHMTFPCSDDRELIMDVLRHGSDVEVIKPTVLRERVVQTAKDIQAIY